MAGKLSPAWIPDVTPSFLAILLPVISITSLPVINETIHLQDLDLVCVWVRDGPGGGEFELWIPAVRGYKAMTQCLQCPSVLDCHKQKLVIVFLRTWRNP